METLLLLSYAAVCFCAFRFFHIPLNKWTVPTAILGGILLVASLVTLMNYNHPYSNITRSYFTTMPIIPTVAGKIATVDINQNSVVKKGEVMMTLDPTPFQQAVNSVKAQLKAAKPDLERIEKLFKKGVVTAHDLDVSRAQVEKLEADLLIAQYNLDETIIKAPTDGYVTQLIVRPGMRASNMPLRPIGIFVNDGETYYIAWFWQNNILRVMPNDKAEVAFDAIPGKVFQGYVAEVMPVLSQGQLQATGNLIGVSGSVSPGRVPVIIKLNDNNFKKYQHKLPGGAFGQAAIYSQHFKEVAVMRQILLRMNAWLNYIFPFH